MGSEAVHEHWVCSRVGAASLREHEQGSIFLRHFKFGVGTSVVYKQMGKAGTESLAVIVDM